MAWFKRIREAQRPFCTALVAAGGSSQRMGTGRSKLLERLDGSPFWPTRCGRWRRRRR